MGSLLLLAALCAVMALASFLVGVLPLSVALSPSQLRLISSLGIGILVGTALVVIIPEGIETISSRDPGLAHSPYAARSILTHSEAAAASSVLPLAVLRLNPTPLDGLDLSQYSGHEIAKLHHRDRGGPPSLAEHLNGESDTAPAVPDATEGQPESKRENDSQTFYIGLSLILGFALMFLIDRLPRHATQMLRSAPQTHHISLDTLGMDGAQPDNEDSDSLLGSLTPSPRRARSLATTTGLVIHAAADGIALGASSTSGSGRLGLVVFVAIMIHKAPAAFGLTSVLLTQGLSKRAARGHLLVFSLAAPIAALSTWFIAHLLGGQDMDGDSENFWAGVLLLFSAGTFLHVAVHAMQEASSPQSHGHGHHHYNGGLNGYVDGLQGGPSKRKGPQMTETLATLTGMMLPILIRVGHHH